MAINQRMKIAIDALPLMMPKTGIGFYTHHLLSEFIRIAPENEYYLCDILWKQIFYNLIKIEDFPTMAETFQHISGFPHPLKIVSRILLFLYTRTTGAKKIENTDLFFGPNFRAIFRDSLKTVITIHDMAHEYYPENVDEKLLRHLKQELPQTARLATLIITDSQNTKMDVLKFLNVPEDKVKVIYIGVDKTFRPINDPIVLEATRKKYHLPGEFILYLGAIQPRKNIAGLIGAYHLLCQDPGFKYHLVVAGGVGWKNQDISRLVVELGLKDRIIFTGYISSLDLPNLYNLAAAFIYPSFYEGFGLPVVEAMACGIPVVTSNNSSLPEVGGDAVIYVNPHSADEVANGIRRILSDKELRSQCIARGLERAKIFSWEKCASETLTVLNEANRMVMASPDSKSFTWSLQ